MGGVERGFESREVAGPREVKQIWGQVGDRFKVKRVEIDRMKRCNLSKKQAEGKQALEIIYE